MGIKSKVVCMFVCVFMASTAQASLVFSDVSYTANTVTFTTTGDLTGYAVPSRPNYFSIGFEGDLFLGSGDTPNLSWSNAIFAGATINNSGYAGDFSSWNNPGAWLQFSTPLSSSDSALGVATTLTLGSNRLNESSLTGEIVFNWDVDSGFTTHTELGRVSVGAVPVPAAVWLFGSGLLGLIGMARRKKS